MMAPDRGVAVLGVELMSVKLVSRGSMSLVKESWVLTMPWVV